MVVEDGGERKIRGDWLLEDDNVRGQARNSQEAGSVGRVYSLWVDACQVLEHLGLLGGRDLLETKRAELLKSVKAC
jgi:hypothetical protein